MKRKRYVLVSLPILIMVGLGSFYLLNHDNSKTEHLSDETNVNYNSTLNHNNDQENNKNLEKEPKNENVSENDIKMEEIPKKSETKNSSEQPSTKNENSKTTTSKNNNSSMNNNSSTNNQNSALNQPKENSPKKNWTDEEITNYVRTTISNFRLDFKTLKECESEGENWKSKYGWGYRCLHLPIPETTIDASMLTLFTKDIYCDGDWTGSHEYYFKNGKIGNVEYLRKLGYKCENIVGNVY